MSEIKFYLLYLLKAGKEFNITKNKQGGEHNKIVNNWVPNDKILVSFDIVNMFPNISDIKGIMAVKLALQNRPSQKPFTECTIEGSEICLFSNNSKFDQDHLLQTNGTATRALNSCSYSDLAIHRLDKLINKDQVNNFG